MSYKVLLLSSLIVLGACSYVKDKHIQDLTVTTPGAHGALCYVYVDGLKYKFRPPQTLSISKSKENLVLDCLAPGNRRKEVIISPQIARSTYGNVATLGAGAAWDYASGAMFKYPDIVEVNFVNTPVRPEGMPAQNNPDILQPEEYPLEEFRPGNLRMNEDRYKQAPQIMKRVRDAEMDSSLTTGYGAPDIDPNAPPSDSMDKSDLMNVIEDLGAGNINPSGEPAPDVSGGQYGPPVPLYPGQ